MYKRTPFSMTNLSRPKETTNSTKATMYGLAHLMQLQRVPGNGMTNHIGITQTGRLASPTMQASVGSKKKEKTMLHSSTKAAASGLMQETITTSSKNQVQRYKGLRRSHLSGVVILPTLWLKARPGKRQKQMPTS